MAAANTAESEAGAEASRPSLELLIRRRHISVSLSLSRPPSTGVGRRERGRTVVGMCADEARSHWVKLSGLPGLIRH